MAQGYRGGLGPGAAAASPPGAGDPPTSRPWWARSATALGAGYAGIYGALIVALFVFSSGHRPPLQAADGAGAGAERGKRRLSKRTVAAAVMILLLVPVTLFVGVYYLGNKSITSSPCWSCWNAWRPFSSSSRGTSPRPGSL